MWTVTLILVCKKGLDVTENNYKSTGPHPQKGRYTVVVALQFQAQGLFYRESYISVTSCSPVIVSEIHNALTFLAIWFRTVIEKIANPPYSRKFKGGNCCGGHLAVTYGGVIVPPDFFVAKAAKFCWAWVAFPEWTQITDTCWLSRSESCGNDKCAQIVPNPKVQ